MTTRQPLYQETGVNLEDFETDKEENSIKNALYHYFSPREIVSVHRRYSGRLRFWWYLRGREESIKRGWRPDNSFPHLFVDK